MQVQSVLHRYYPMLRLCSSYVTEMYCSRVDMLDSSEVRMHTHINHAVPRGRLGPAPPLERVPRVPVPGRRSK